MKTIWIGYYHIPLKDCKYCHGEEIDYSIKNRNNIINYVIDLGYNVMLIQSKEILKIFIDNKTFKQR